VNRNSGQQQEPAEVIQHDNSATLNTVRIFRLEAERMSMIPVFWQGFFFHKNQYISRISMLRSVLSMLRSVLSMLRSVLSMLRSTPTL